MPVGNAIGMLHLVVNGLDIKAGHVEAASKILNFLLQFWDPWVYIKCPAVSGN